MGCRRPLSFLDPPPAEFRSLSRIRTQFKGGRPGPPVQVRLRRRGAVRGTVVISATGTSAPAQEWDYLRGGLFTHHLMTAISGAADFDRDGHISLVEAYTYAYRADEVQRVFGVETPDRTGMHFGLAGFVYLRFPLVSRLSWTIEVTGGRRRNSFSSRMREL